MNELITTENISTEKWNSDQFCDIPILCLSECIQFSIYYLNLNKEILPKQSISLKDPILFTQISIPCRTIYCNHLQCFELQTYETFNQNLLPFEYSCPICKAKANPSRIYIDLVWVYLLQKYPFSNSLDIDIFGEINTQKEREIPMETIILDDDGNFGDIPISQNNCKALSSKNNNIVLKLQEIISVPIPPHLTRHQVKAFDNITLPNLNDILAFLNFKNIETLREIPVIKNTCLNNIEKARPFFGSQFDSLFWDLAAKLRFSITKNGKLMICQINSKIKEEFIEFKKRYYGQKLSVNHTNTVLMKQVASSNKTIGFNPSLILSQIVPALDTLDPPQPLKSRCSKCFSKTFNLPPTLNRTTKKFKAISTENNSKDIFSKMPFPSFVVQLPSTDSSIKIQSIFSNIEYLIHAPLFNLQSPNLKPSQTIKHAPILIIDLSRDDIDNDEKEKLSTYGGRNSADTKGPILKPVQSISNKVSLEINPIYISPPDPLFKSSSQLNTEIPTQPPNSIFHSSNSCTKVLKRKVQEIDSIQIQKSQKFHISNNERCNSQPSQSPQSKKNFQEIEMKLPPPQTKITPIENELKNQSKQPQKDSFISLLMEDFIS